jgi:hypothetical protein
VKENQQAMSTRNTPPADVLVFEVMSEAMHVYSQLDPYPEDGQVMFAVRMATGRVLPLGNGPSAGRNPAFDLSKMSDQVPRGGAILMGNGRPMERAMELTARMPSVRRSSGPQPF